MDRNTRDAFRAWSSGYFMDGTQYFGWENIEDGDKAAMQRIDDVLDKSVLKQGVVVTRLATARLIMDNRNATLKQMKAQKGKIVKCKGNLSTGAASEGLVIGDSGKKCEYHIHIPPSKGAGMWIGDQRINGWGAVQREFIMNRDSFYEVGDTVYDSKRNKYVTDIYWRGRDKHDYGTSGRV